MIVQCPSCSSRYRVNDSNIPATGGRINCPSCAHSFIVYPEAKAAPAPSAYDGEKTSVATNFNDLMRGAGFGAPSQAPADDDGDLATEVISGDSLPNFAGGMFGGGAPPSRPPEEDGTVEMENPLKFLSQGGSLPGMGGGLGGDVSETYDPTQVVSADMASALGGLGGPAASPFGAPPSQGGDDALRTEIVSAEDAAASFGFGGGAAASGDNAMTEVVDPHSVFNAPASPPAQNHNPFGGPPAMPSFANQPAAHPQQPQPSTPLFGGAPPATPSSFGDAPGLQGLQSPMGDPGQPGLGGVPGASIDSLPPVGADPNHQGPWKLKTNFGLTYEFQDTGSLLGWMANKDDFTGYTLSVGDEDFHPLGDFPQISAGVSGKPSNPEAVAPPVEQPAAGAHGGALDPFAGAPAPAQFGGFGSGGFDGVGGMPQHQQPRSPGPTPQAPAASGLPAHPTSGGGSSVILWVVFGILFIAVSLLGLQITGVVDFKAMLGGGAPAPVEQPAPVASPGNDEPTGDVDEPGDEAVAAPDGAGEEGVMSAEDRTHFNELIEMARTSMSEKKYQSAKGTLEKAKMIGPGELPVYTLLAEVHEKLGEEDLALEAKKKAEDIRMNMNME